ncbi:EamA family transporter [Flavobacterium sp. MAH-1]|uniref:EamA family transporter n=1 Tax=Flavobacterium agri TaxID=2743471 RepID=A0A7Y9C5V6_9FLAO|nr:EamA family transporter [Flavobacterium agri]NUY79743.1 EamA family transporter [Flavobacterium agri]NYA69768.1 EamA family transporter [Flavobacterium agri]
MNNSRYYLSAVSAFLIWGLFSLALRPIKQFPPLEILFYRIITCLVLLVVLVFVFRKKSVSDTKNFLKNLSVTQRRSLILWNLLAGLLLTSNWFIFIYVMNFVSVKATSLAYLVCPILTAVLANLLLKEQMKKLQWVALLVGAIGCSMLALGHFMDLLLSILIAFSYALYLILQKKNAGIDSFVVLTLHVSIAVLALLPVLPFFEVGMPTEPKFYTFILIIATCFTIFPMFLSLYALKGIKSSTVGMLMNINPIIAFALSVFHFNEEADAWQYAAYSVVFVSVVLFNIPALIGRKEIAA